LEILSEEETEQIHVASLEILSSSGVKIDDPSAREMLKQNGAEIDEHKGIVILLFLNRGPMVSAKSIGSRREFLITIRPLKIRLCDK